GGQDKRAIRVGPVFLDESEQLDPSRGGLGPLLAVGCVLIPEVIGYRVGLWRVGGGAGVGGGGGVCGGGAFGGGGGRRGCGVALAAKSLTAVRKCGLVVSQDHGGVVGRFSDGHAV